MKSLITLLFISLILAACGGGQKNSGYQSGSDLCNQNFLDEYNKLHTKIVNLETAIRNSTVTKEGARVYIATIKADADTLRKNYPGLNCKARDIKRGGTRYVNVDTETKTVIDSMDKALKALN
jgi:hypothetical protein